jgi:hypothetical protein
LIILINCFCFSVFCFSGDLSVPEQHLTLPWSIPKLRVKKNWYKGFDMHTPDLKDEIDTENTPGIPEQTFVADNIPSNYQPASTDEEYAQRLAEFTERLKQQGLDVSAEAANEGFKKLNNLKAEQMNSDIPSTNEFTEPVYSNRRLLEDTTENEDDIDYSQIGDGLTENARESLSLFTDTNDMIDDYDTIKYPKEKDFIWLDAHVLATPVLCDVNNDMVPDLIVSVSYYFDETDFHNMPEVSITNNAEQILIFYFWIFFFSSCYI